MSEPVTPLAGAEAAPRPDFRMADAGPVGQVTLKGDLSSPAVAAALETMAGAPVPAPLSVVAGREGARVVWMAPDEVLVLLGPGQGADAAIAAAVPRLEGTHHLLLDVSDARAVLRLEGADVAETLAKGVPVDLSESAFPPGTARRTHLSGIAVGIFRHDAAVWEVVCFRSVAHHLWAWLLASAAPGARVGRF